MDDFSGFMSEEADKPTNVSQHFDCSDVFTTTQIFPTRDDLLYWAREVGKENNIVVVIVRSDIETGQRGRKNKIILGCERGGKYRSKSSSSSSKSSGSHKCECPFALKGRYLSTGEGWILKVLCGIHNHRIPESMMGHPFVGRLSQNEKEIVHDMTKCNVKPGNILLTLKQRNAGNLTTISQVYNERHKFRSTQKGPRTEMQHLLNLIQRDRYVFWYRRHDDSDVVRDIFWAHPDAINLLNTFHVVLSMDSTYKTNRYRLPLFEIVGVTSTSLTYTVAFAYLDSEQQDNFEWALLKLKGLFVRQESFPQVILTDRDLALMNAIAFVFPTSANLLCQWHIGKNVYAKCKKLVFREDKHEAVKNAWDGVVDVTDEFEYHTRLMTFECVCSEFPIFVEYVKNTWLNPFKEKFVAAWTNRVMHFGNTTTNRAESAHWTLKRNLQNSRGDLCHCWEAMNNMLTLQHIEIKASFERSINVVEHRHNNRLFIRLHGFVSRAALQLIADECSRVDYVGIDKSACGCLIRTTHGLPCACELAGYTTLFAPIPLEAVHSHWRSLHFGEHQQQQDQVQTEGGVSEEELAGQWDALVMRFRSLNVIGKRTLFAKVRELVSPDTTSMCPPPQKVKTKGAPKKGKGKAPAMDGYDARRDPSYFEHVDNMYSDVPSGNTSKASNAPSNVRTRKKKRSPYLCQFPPPIHSYIEEIVDVKDDGNCGYRSIAALLGKSEDGWSIVRQDLEKEMRMHYDLYGRLFGDQYQPLRESLLGVAGTCFRDKWMSLPDMGYVIATKYKLILVSLNECSQTCWTFSPLRGMYQPIQSNNAIISIGFVNKNHWVQIFLKPGCPLPNIAPSWCRYSSPEAQSYATMYVARLQEWFTLFPPLHTYTPQDPDNRVRLDDD